MLSAGAYSKKYQQLERERVQNVREQERRGTRERTLMLSKQTAQRRKALEEKKRAMAVAEEQRRQKALEERRKAQHEATARFKSAIVRMKSNPTRPKNKPGENLEIYLPDKAKPKNTTGAQNGQIQNKNTPGSQQQRVAYGRDVEIKRGSLQRRTPSLDDVLGQIRGGGDMSTRSNGHPPPNNTHTHGRINVHHHPPVPSTTVVQQQLTSATITDQSTNPMLRGRSASDPNLTSLAARSSTNISKAQHTRSSAVNSDQKDEVSAEGEKLNVMEVEVSPNASDELMLFKPVKSVGGGRPHPNSSLVAGRLMQTDDGTRVVSPEPADSSTSSDRSSSPPLNDSLEQPASRYVVSSVAKQMKASRQQHEQAARRRVKLTSQRRPDSGDSLKNGQQSSVKAMVVSATAHVHTTSPTPTPPPTPPPPSQPIYVCQENSSLSDDVGDSDSLNEEGSYSSHRRPPPYQSRKQFHRKVDTASHDTSRNDQGVESRAVADSDELAMKEIKPKIVGILKKTSTCSVELSQTGLSTGTLATDSGSLASSSSATNRTQKRVRFIDQVSSTSKHSHHAPNSDNVWNKVLPNSLNAHHLPNSAFTPKMRLFLSSKASTIPPAAINGPPKRSTAPSTLNGITVHVPGASMDNPSSPSHRQLQHGNSGKEVTAKEVQSSTKEDNDGHEHSRLFKIGDDSSSNSSSSASGKKSGDQLLTSKALDKTPTDNEINEMWDQIRTCLDREDGKQSTVPVQVYPFQAPPVNSVQYHTTSGVSSVYVREAETDTSAVSLQRDRNQSPAPPQYSNYHNHQHKTNDQSGIRLVHRQSNRSRPMRCHHQAQMHTHTQLSRRQQNNYHHSHSATYPYSEQEQAQAHRQHRGYPPNAQMSSREPELVVRATASTINGRTTPTSLSLEEQRILQSIDKLNQRLKDHLASRPQEPVFQPSSSPEPHDYYRQPHRHLYPHPPPPHNSKTRGHSDLHKHWHQQATPPSVAAINNSRRTKTQKHDFYNT